MAPCSLVERCLTCQRKVLTPFSGYRNKSHGNRQGTADSSIVFRNLVDSFWLPRVSSGVPAAVCPFPAVYHFIAPSVVCLLLPLDLVLIFPLSLCTLKMEVVKWHMGSTHALLEGVCVILLIILAVYVNMRCTWGVEWWRIPHWCHVLENPIFWVERIIQGDQNVSVHLMITVQTTRKNVLNSFNHLPW
jgi:hypothetical protein